MSAHENLLVGYNKADDAGVYKLTDDIALVQTVDFFPPIVDDPFTFGQIAAANALSDVYAMGGRPLTGLNILGFPAGKLDESVLTEVLRGGGDKLVEAGAVVVGGHSVKDDELKYGVAVTGIVHPDHIVTNGGARPGDVLYLTKPLGTGLITTGIKRQAVGPELEKIVAMQMAQLNRAAAELMVAHGVHAATDITGYGLLGHAFEMAVASTATLQIIAEALPLMPQAMELAAAKMIPGGANANRDFMLGKASIASGLDENLVAVLFDPQTSGGLLIAIPSERAGEFEASAGDRVSIWRIGSVLKAGSTPILVN